MLLSISPADREVLRKRAGGARLEKWKQDTIGRIKGVRLIIFQYLRMMGGVGTVMPDKIVKRVINEILVKAGLEWVDDDMEFIRTAEEVARKCGYRPIELCWMTWLIQPEVKRMKVGKYSHLLSRI